VAEGSQGISLYAKSCSENASSLKGILRKQLTAKVLTAFRTSGDLRFPTIL